MKIKIPRFSQPDRRIEYYEAIADDGAILKITYNEQWESWFWRVERSNGASVSGSAPNYIEAQERAISAWIATR